MFDMIDFRTCEILYREDSVEQKEDLLLLKCPNGRLIDVGWYGKRNRFCITVVQNEQWDSPCYRIHGQPKLEYIEHHLQKVIDFETAVFEPEEQAILREITNAIDCWSSGQGDFIALVRLLEQLRDKGLPQNKVANYIEIYSIPYVDSDVETWDVACELLDQIVGWCAPDLHIWRDSQ